MRRAAPTRLPRHSVHQRTMAETPYLRERRFPRADELAQLFASANLPEYVEAVHVVERIAERIRAAGGRTRLVGGIVRDVLLGKVSKDIDIEVAGAPMERITEVVTAVAHDAGGTITEAGKVFAVMKVALPNGVEIDVAPPRRDTKVAAGHRGFDVTYDPDMTDEDAFRRRDFTINAMGADLETGELIDPFGGVQDLEENILRVVDPRTFAEDALRVLRGLQFVARFGFRVHPDTAATMRELAPQAAKEPSARVGEEWMKLLTKSPRPSEGMQLGMELGIYQLLHPELRDLLGAPARSAEHPGGSAWERTCRSVDAAARIARERGIGDDEAKLLLLTALCRELGQQHAAGSSEAPPTPNAGASSCVAPFLRRLEVHRRTILEVERLVAERRTPGRLRALADARGDVPLADLRAALERLAPAQAPTLALVTVACTSELDEAEHARQDAEELARWFVAQASRLPIGHGKKPAPAISGAEVLQLLRRERGGPQFRTIIDLASQLSDRGASKREIEVLLSQSRDLDDAIAQLREELGEAA